MTKHAAKDDRANGAITLTLGKSSTALDTEDWPASVVKLLKSISSELEIADSRHREVKTKLEDGTLVYETFNDVWLREIRSELSFISTLDLFRGETLYAIDFPDKTLVAVITNKDGVPRDFLVKWRVDGEKRRAKSITTNVTKQMKQAKGTGRPKGTSKDTLAEDRKIARGWLSAKRQGTKVKVFCDAWHISKHRLYSAFKRTGIPLE